jgi:hypothetical protein
MKKRRSTNRASAFGATSGIVAPSRVIDRVELGVGLIDDVAQQVERDEDAQDLLDRYNLMLSGIVVPFSGGMAYGTATAQRDAPGPSTRK